MRNFFVVPIDSHLSLLLCVGWSAYKGAGRNNVGRKRPYLRVWNERDAAKAAARGARLSGRLWNGTGNERLASVPGGRVLDVLPGMCVCVLMRVRWLCGQKESVSQSVSRSRASRSRPCRAYAWAFCFFFYFSLPSPLFSSFLVRCGVSTWWTLGRGSSPSRCSPTGIYRAT